MGKYGKVLAQAKDISMIENFEALPQIASFDSDRVRRVLDNLFSNAVKFSHRGKRIVFSVRGGEGRLNFAVADQGLGIAENEISNLFREFGKTSTRPTEGENSTGLGLAIVQRIVNQHGGTVSVESRPQVGSTFSFWIPSNRT
jgi:signal transduction histidine kinase